MTVVVPASKTFLTMFRGQIEGKNKTQVNVHNRWWTGDICFKERIAVVVSK